MSWKLAPCGALSLLLCACSTLTPDGPGFDNTMLMPKMAVSTATDAARSSNNPPTAATYIEPTSCQAYDQETTKSQVDRNQCITEIMTVIDAAYQKYQLTVNNNIGRVNFTLDTLSTAGSVASTAAGGTAAKVLSAVAAMASGSKTALSEDILYKATVQVLLTTMKANRDKDAAAIKLSMRQDVAAYPMSVAKNDLLKYLNDGTLIEAFASVNQNASATAQACQNANEAVSNATKSGSLSPQTAKTAATLASRATTAQTQCSQIASAVSFQWDASTTATTLLHTLASSSGVVNAKAVAALRGCVGSVAAPAGVDLNTYKNPDGSIDVAQIDGDDKLDPAYKSKLLSCVQTALKS